MSLFPQGATDLIKLLAQQQACLIPAGAKTQRSKGYNCVPGPECRPPAFEVAGAVAIPITWVARVDLSHPSPLRAAHLSPERSWAWCDLVSGTQFCRGGTLNPAVSLVAC